MKFSLDWLKEFINVRRSPEELVHQLTMAGLEVESLQKSGDQAIFTLGITPNRGDCLSIQGLAREVSALQQKRFEPKKTDPPKGVGAIKDIVSVKVADTKGCPRYMARAIRGIKVGPSPAWMQERLTQVGLRPINNVVDCTNYVMWELGHPLHAFDARFLNGGQIIVRREKGPIRFTTLDGEERKCLPEDLFICDAMGPVALAGIMGGKNSEVRESTKDIILEAAYFDPKTIHHTSKRLGLNSESSHRFERGVDSNGVANALHRLVALIVQTAGGEPTSDWIDVYLKKLKPTSLVLPLGEIKRHLGLDLSSKEVGAILNNLGFSVAKGTKAFRVQVPTFRSDITRTIDLVEEVVRLKGYDHVPWTLPNIQISGPLHPKERSALKKGIDCLLGLGYSETCHYSFTSLKKSEPFNTDSGEMVPLSNPLSEEHAVMRSSLLPGLLDAVAFNHHRQRNNIKLFEIKKIFWGKGDGVFEGKRLSVVASGLEWDLQWQLKKRGVDFYSLKGLLEQLAADLHLKPFQFVSKEIPSFLVSTSSSWVDYEGHRLGWVGLLTPQLLKLWGIEEDVVALEVDWERLAVLAGESPVRFKPISKFPFIERDLALVVDSTLPEHQIEQAIWETKNGWIQKVQLFDLFKGGSLPLDKKSLAFNIRYASLERTLTNDEINEAHLSLINHLERTLPAQLRK